MESEYMERGEPTGFPDKMGISFEEKEESNDDSKILT